MYGAGTGRDLLSSTRLSEFPDQGAKRRRVDDVSQPLFEQDEDSDDEMPSSIRPLHRAGDIYSEDDEEEEGLREAEDGEGREGDEREENEAGRLPYDQMVDADDADVDVNVLDRLRKMSKGAAKRVVKNPRPKLDSTRLLSDRGLPDLLKAFETIQWRGKGHEFRDLDRLLFVYEAWANRLAPAMPFDAVVERFERLGSKREVQVTLRKLRDGIWPCTVSDEFVAPEDDEDSQDGYPLPVPADLDEQEQANVDGDKDDDDLFWQRIMAMSSSNNKCGPLASTTADNGVSNKPLDDPDHVPATNDDGGSYQGNRLPNLSPTPDSSSTQRPSTSSTMIDLTLTDEERVERKRLAAMERLKQRQAAASSQSSISSSQQHLSGRGNALLKNALLQSSSNALNSSLNNSRA